jgi:hypothetical protein
MASNGPRPHLRVVAAAGEAGAGAQEFAVRFTPAGPLAWLRRPRNPFGWVGGGTLCFDERGLEIRARTLTPAGVRRTRRVLHASDIADASRTGAAMRITLREAGRPAVVSLAARDAATAAHIMTLLPTRRTVELDHASAGAAHERARPGIAWLLVAAATLLLAAVWVVRTRFVSSPPPPPAAPRPAAPAPAPRGNALEQAVTEASEAEALLAWADLERFGRAADALTVQFGSAFNALLEGPMSQEEFASGLERWLAPQWRVLEKQLPPPGGAISLRTLADEQLRGTIDDWQRALELYAHGLRSHDVGEVNRAFALIRSAEGHQARARALLAELEQRHRDGTRQSAAH